MFQLHGRGMLCKPQKFITGTICNNWKLIDFFIGFAAIVAKTLKGAVTTMQIFVQIVWQFCCITTWKHILQQIFLAIFFVAKQLFTRSRSWIYFRQSFSHSTIFSSNMYRRNIQWNQPMKYSSDITWWWKWVKLRVTCLANVQLAPRQNWEIERL